MKEPRLDPAATRREFLHGSARYALLTGVAAVVAVVAGRRNATLSGQTCVSNGLCRGCAVVSDCGLPQALSFKQATKGRGT
jgi:hypothetical protein